MLKLNNKVLNINGNWLNAGSSPVPPAPVLPDKTIRLKYADGVTPTFSKGTAVQVSSSPNVCDLTCNDSWWCFSTLSTSFYSNNYTFKSLSNFQLLRCKYNIWFCRIITDCRRLEINYDSTQWKHSSK